MIKPVDSFFHFTFITVQNLKIGLHIPYENFTTHNCCFRRTVILSEFCNKCFNFRYKICIITVN